MNAATQEIDLSSYVTADEKEGRNVLNLTVDGMHCASCAWRIESTLNSEKDVKARVNLSTNRLVLIWGGKKERGNELVAKAADLGFRFAPFDPAAQNSNEASEEKFLLRCIAIAGFAAGNIMLFSFALWFSTQKEMGVGTRDLLHWVSALIALPAIIYAGQPYFRSALNALQNFRTNMDVPISLAVILAAAMSVLETMRHGEYVYFDSSTMLLFFLLIGRYFDRKARGRAREAARDLLAMMQGSATIAENEKSRLIPIRDILPGMKLLVASGEKIAADGIVTSGTSEADTSLITGETIPQKIAPGQKVFAGMINLSAPIELSVSAASDHSLLADIVRLMENAEQSQSRYVRLADKVAGYYTPVVHLLALGAFVYWFVVAGIAWQKALLIATTVLIITCPCALGLAVPVVQVVASGLLFRKAMLLKSGDALERIAKADTVIFDKTGTLTLGKPKLKNTGYNMQDLQLAASMAGQSRHPLARALHQAWNGDIIKLQVTEDPGNGLSAFYQGKTIKLGRRDWCGNAAAPQDEMLEMWLRIGDATPLRFAFSDTLRPDAEEVIRDLKAKHYNIILLSGDREPVVRSVADALGIGDFAAALTPVEKTARIRVLREKGRHTLMVGDGLNDAPALAAADVSMSPSSAIDITQNAADIVFQGENLAPVAEAIAVARESIRLVKQNFMLSFAYNVIAIPLALMGEVTPLIAAIAMSSSSITVLLNALRLNKLKTKSVS